MVSVAVGVVFAVGKLFWHIKTKTSLNREMMNLVEETLSGTGEVLRHLGNVNPVRISSEMKRKIEILLDKLSRYIQKRLKKSSFMRMFKLDTERFKTKNMMQELRTLLQVFQTLQLNELINRIESNLEKLDNVFGVLEKINEKATKVDEKLKFLINRFGSASDLCHSFKKLNIEKMLEFNGYYGNCHELIKCLKCYFRIQRMLKPGLSNISYYSKLKISKYQLESFESTYLINGLLKDHFFNNKVIPLATSIITQDLNHLQLHLLALESGIRPNDFKKGDLLNIEGPIVRENIKYSYISRSNPVGIIEMDHPKKLFKLIPCRSDIKIYYLVKSTEIISNHDEFIIQTPFTSKHFIVENISSPNHPKTTASSQPSDQNDFETFDPRRTTKNTELARITIRSTDQVYDFYSTQTKNTGNDFLCEFIETGNQIFKLNPKRKKYEPKNSELKEKSKNQVELVWLKIREEPFYLTTSTVLKIHDKNFQVVYSLL